MSVSESRVSILQEFEPGLRYERVSVAVRESEPGHLPASVRDFLSFEVLMLIAEALRGGKEQRIEIRVSPKT